MRQSQYRRSSLSLLDHLCCQSACRYRLQTEKLVVVAVVQVFSWNLIFVLLSLKCCLRVNPGMYVLPGLLPQVTRTAWVMTGGPSRNGSKDLIPAWMRKGLFYRASRTCVKLFWLKISGSRSCFVCVFLSRVAFFGLRFLFCTASLCSSVRLSPHLPTSTYDSSRVLNVGWVRCTLRVIEKNLHEGRYVSPPAAATTSGICATVLHRHWGSALELPRPRLTLATSSATSSKPCPDQRTIVRRRRSQARARGRGSG